MKVPKREDERESQDVPQHFATSRSDLSGERRGGGSSLNFPPIFLILLPLVSSDMFKLLTVVLSIFCYHDTEKEEFVTYCVLILSLFYHCPSTLDPIEWYFQQNE